MLPNGSVNGSAERGTIPTMTPAFSHADSVLASAAGVGTTLSLAAQNPPDPAQPWSYLTLLPTVLGPALVVIANRYLAAQAARKVVRAAQLRTEGEEALTNSDTTDDAEGRRKVQEAAQLDAEAIALRGGDK
jgi:hypothetical protein